VSQNINELAKLLCYKILMNQLYYYTMCFINL